MARQTSKDRDQGPGIREQSETTPIAIADLRTAPWNARKSFDPAALNELAESIRQHGVLVDLIVRPVDLDCMDGETLPGEPQFGDAFEIVAGERRFRAAQIADLRSLPCKIRVLTDDQAREIGLVDNLQREDLPAMEEASGFAELLKTLGSIEAVAARVQKDQGYVAKRLKLCSCSAWVADALRGRLITVDHALLLARLGADEQDAALKWTLDRNAGSKTPVDKVIAMVQEIRRDEEKDRSERWRHTWEPATVQALKDHIAGDAGILLERAPWNLDEAGMTPDAPACSACPQNTKANAPLFGDLGIDESRCTDGGCFKEKTQAFVRIQARVSEGTAAPLRVSWKATTTAPRQEKDGSGPNLAQAFKAGQWIEAKKGSCEHARQAVTVDWSDANGRGYMDSSKKLRKPGELIQVCVQPKCKAHAKDYEKAQRQHRTAEPDDAACKELQQLQANFAKYEPPVRESVFCAILNKLEPIKALLLLNDEDRESPALRKELLKRRPKLAGWELEALVAFVGQFGDSRRVNEYYMANSGVDKDRAELWELAKKAGINPDQCAAAALPLTMPAHVRDKLCPVSLRKKVKAAAAKKPAKKAVAKKAAKKGGRK